MESTLYVSMISLQKETKEEELCLAMVNLLKENKQCYLNYDVKKLVEELQDMAAKNERESTVTERKMVNHPCIAGN